MGVTVIDYNQPQWLAEFNRRGERIAELEAERDRLREALKEVLNCEVVTDTGFDCNEVKEIIRGALEGANNGDAVAECKLFEDIVLIEQVLKKARGEA